MKNVYKINTLNDQLSNNSGAINFKLKLKEYERECLKILEGDINLFSSMKYKTRMMCRDVLTSNEPDSFSMVKYINEKNFQTDEMGNYDSFILCLIEYNAKAILYIESPNDEMYSKAICYKPWLIKHIKHQTKKTCTEAVLNDPFCLKYVRDIQNVDSEVLEKILMQNEDIYDFLDKKKQTAEMCIKMVEKYPYAIRYVKNQTDNLCLIAADGVDSSYFFESVKCPSEYVLLYLMKKNPHNIALIKNPSFEICKFATQSKPIYFEYIKPDNPQLTIEQYDQLCTMAVKKYYRYIKDILNPSYDVCKIVVLFYGGAIKYIKPENPKLDNHQYNELCKIAVGKNYKAIKYIKPDNSRLTDLQYNELCKIPIEENSSYYFRYISNPSYDICEMAIKHWDANIQYINPDNPNLTFDQYTKLCMICIRHGYNCLKFMKIIPDAVCFEVINRNANCIRFIPNPSKEVCLQALKKLLHIPNSLTTTEMIEKIPLSSMLKQYIPLQYIDYYLSIQPQNLFNIENIHNFDKMTMTGNIFNKFFNYLPIVKITNEEEIHNGYKFQTGLNIDTNTYDKTVVCGNGIYFTWCPSEWVSLYNSRGLTCYIRKVIVPDDAIVTFGIQKIKADKVFLEERISWHKLIFS